MANNDDPDQMQLSVASDLIYNLCSGLSVRIPRIILIISWEISTGFLVEALTVQGVHSIDSVGL